MEQTMERAGNFLNRSEEAAGSGRVENRVVTLTAPASQAAEQYRTLYYRLERLRLLKPMRLVALTSAVPGEGKTLTAVNLALTAARAAPERRILLVDADLRRGRVASTLGVRGRPGLAELLGGECQIHEAVRRFHGTRLAVVPAGGTAEEPTRMLSSARMRELIASMREEFDEVYIDLPPALPFADASILGAQMDGLLMVVRAHRTSSRVVEEALDVMGGTPLVGCVLNGAQALTRGYGAR